MAGPSERWRFWFAVAFTRPTLLFAGRRPKPGGVLFAHGALKAASLYAVSERTTVVRGGRDQASAGVSSAGVSSAAAASAYVPSGCSVFSSTTLPEASVIFAFSTR